MSLEFIIKSLEIVKLNMINRKEKKCYLLFIFLNLNDVIDIFNCC